MSKRFRSARNIAMVLAAVFAGGLGGCTKKMWITQIPEWWTPELGKISIAVVSFRNQTADRTAGDIMSDELANALRANGSYENVFNRNDLRTLLDQRDLQLALGGSNASLAAQLRDVPGLNVQALLVGSVITYTATSRSQRKIDQRVVAYTKQGNPIVRPVAYTYTRNEANVSATAALIRIRDGSTIYATPSPPPNWQQWAEGSPPKQDAYACLAVARSNVVSQLLTHFSVTRRQIEVKVGKDFRTASELYDNKWTWTNSFAAGDEKAYVVLTLPASCDRNRFRITIIRDQQREDLFASDLVWDRQYGGRGIEFSPKDVAAKGGGPGAYVAKFYSGSEPVLTYKFTITAGR